MLMLNHADWFMITCILAACVNEAGGETVKLSNPKPFIEVSICISNVFWLYNQKFV